MSLDAYSPCPCGSGKKLKFCCQPIAGEFDKIERLRQNHQIRQALQTVEALERKHPDFAWTALTRAELLLQDDRADEAVQVLEALLEKEPDHKYALALLAVASFSADGYELAKPAIHRAFQRCARDFPGVIGDLAMGVAAYMLEQGHHLAARASLVLALRIAPQEQKSEIFVRLLEFDGNRRIPYPLRSVHELAKWSGEDAGDSATSREEFRKAEVLSALGCWRPAARLFTRLTEKHPEEAPLWYNAGLTLAWDGDEKAAAAALFQAASLQDEFETAVEWETLAQLLDYNTTDNRVQLLSRHYRTDSVARLLTVLDDNDRFTRIELPPDEETAAPAGMYYVLDHPERLQDDPRSYTRETVPTVHAQITLFDRPANDTEKSGAEEEEQAEKGPLVLLTGTEGEAFDEACRLFERAAGELVRHEEEEDDSTPTVPRELSCLMWRWYFPPKTPLSVQRRLELQQWQHVTEEVWPETALAALDGKTPNEAAGDPEKRVPLRAALTVLDAYCDRSQYCLNQSVLFEKLRLEAPAPVQFEGEASLNSLTSMQLLRIPVRELDDEQLALVVQRAALVHHSGFLYTVLTEVVRRPECLKHFEAERLYQSLVEVCREQGKQDEALQYIHKGKEHAREGERAFERVLQWTLRELMLRLEDPDDPQLAPLLQHIQNYYLPKLPELRETVTALVTAFGVTPPWEETAPAAVGVPGAGEATEGVWTPDGTSPEPEAGKKLWLPGQQ